MKNHIGKNLPAKCTASAEGHSLPLCGDAAAQKIGYPSYLAYLRSDLWRSSGARLKAYRLAAGHCRVCGRRGGDIRLEVHHATYDRLGAELCRDLIVVCKRCHTGITTMLNALAVPDPVDVPPSLAMPSTIDEHILTL